MAGILGTQAAATPKKGGGMFGWFNDDPGAITGPADTGRAPLTGAQKQGLLFSGIADAIDTLQGRAGDTTENLSKQYAADYTKNKADARRTAVNQAIQKAYAAGDMDAVRSAILSADPADISHIHDALDMLKPKVEHYGESDNVVSVDPFGNRTTLQTGQRPAPSGYDWAPDHKSLSALPGGPGDPNNPQNMKPPSGFQWAPGTQPGQRVQPIPGYIDGAGVLAGVRRAPAKGPVGVINLPHPGSQY